MASKMPPASEKQPAVGELPGGEHYESIITAVGTLAEQTPGGVGVSATGKVSVIQGRVDENPAAGFFAFLSVDTLNVPLVSTSKSSRVSPGCYRVRIPDKEFLLTLDPRTEPGIVDGMENVLHWFTTFEGSTVPAGTGSAPAGEHATGIQGLIEKAGVAGAALVTRAGEKLNAVVKDKTEATLAAQGDQPAKKVKLGGAVTATTLTGARKVVGAGAGVAAAVIDKVSSVAGNAVANSSIVQGSRKAPEGSTRRQTHDLLVTGAMAVARVWEAADGQGKLLLESTGDGMGRIAGAKYGEEAEHAARSAGQIGLDGWRIFRFPTKLGVTTLVKGVVKGAAGGQQSSGGGVTEYVAQPAAPAAVAAPAAPTSS
eukprot:g7701.t1